MGLKQVRAGDGELQISFPWPKVPEIRDVFKWGLGLGRVMCPFRFEKVPFFWVKPLPPSPCSCCCPCWVTLYLSASS